VAASERPIYFGVIFSERSKQEQFVAALAQVREHGIGQGGALVAAYGNFHVVFSYVQYMGEIVAEPQSHPCTLLLPEYFQ
jgi:hypothetical protein